MKRDVSSLLRSLIDEEKGKRWPDPAAEPCLTILGAPLDRQGDGRFVIDLTNVRVFRNLHTFVQLLISEVIEQCGFGVADIMVRRRIDPHLTPDLAAAGVDWVALYARLDTAEGLPFDHRYFGNCMQVLFRTPQSGRWGGTLFPTFFGLAAAPDAGAPALLFPFHLHEHQAGAAGHLFLKDVVTARRLGK